MLNPLVTAGGSQCGAIRLRFLVELANRNNLNYQKSNKKTKMNNIKTNK